LVTNPAYACTSSQKLYNGFLSLNMLFTMGMSVVATNLLLHRYLLERSKELSRM
jgi:hypothetical protein